jgi:hypothetical protein
MTEFTNDELKIIFNAVRYYQTNYVPLNGKLYQNCETILNKTFPIAKNVTPTKVSTDAGQ